MRPFHILVVEDDRVIRQLLCKFLELEGYAVHEAENGKVALHELAIHKKTDLILLDLRMPVMNGWTFLTLKNELASLSTIPVILTSGETDVPVDASICAVLPKPIHFSYLLSEIRFQLHRFSAASSKVL
jgi:DNA-binding response OmpR family regulator